MIPVSQRKNHLVWFLGLLLSCALFLSICCVLGQRRKKRQPSKKRHLNRYVVLHKSVAFRFTTRVHALSNGLHLTAEFLSHVYKSSFVTKSLVLFWLRRFFCHIIAISCEAPQSFCCSSLILLRHMIPLIHQRRILPNLQGSIIFARIFKGNSLSAPSHPQRTHSTVSVWWSSSDTIISPT